MRRSNDGGAERPRFGRIIGVETLLLVILALGLTLAIPSPASATVPDSFRDSLVINVDSPTDLAFTPGGRLVVATQPGVLYVVSSGQLVPMLDLSDVICSDFERGLLGVAFDPDFAGTSAIYLFYTYAKYGGCADNSSQSPVNRVSRFTVSGNTVIRSSEQVLIDGMPSPNGNHNAGDLAFGKDGLLYVGIGDGGCDLTSSSKCAGQSGNARRTNVLTGKILRITKDGGIPAGNPYTGSNSGRCGLPGGNGRTDKTYCQETFAWGLRNPFRLAFDPNASGTRFYINDVGQDTWEEIDLGAKGADYGWNVREGFCANGSATSCGAPPAGMTNPVAAYSHGSGCASITGGAFVPNGLWPAQYDGDYLYADYVCGKIFRLEGGSSSEFASGLGPITTMAFGPYGRTQALYYAGYNGQVRRITYTGQVNRPPVANATANPAFGLTPLQVSFDGRASTDPDGDTLTYSWDFKDGSPAGTGAQVTHTFATNGVYQVELTVSDGKGGSAKATVKVDAGNTPPSATIDSPAPTDTFAVGQQITLQATATDDQDGPLPATALAWTVRLHHDQHEHPFFDGVGNGLTFVAPAPEDLLAASNSYLSITLTVTDSGGLQTTVTRDLQPEKVTVTLASDPPGAQLFVEGKPFTAGATVLTWAGNTLDVTTPDQVLPDGEAVRFAAWSVPGGRDLGFVVPDTDTTLTARFDVLSGNRITPVADARVREGSPTKNEGTSTGLTVRGGTSSDLETLLRFDVSGVGAGGVASATLFLYAYDGTTDGPAVFRTSGSWTETVVTWNNRPPSSGAALSDAGAVPAKSWVALDVTSAVTGNGPVDLLLRAGSTDAASFYSREAASRRPLLIVVLGGPGGDATPPSVPANVAADPPDSASVALTWSPSTDDTGVAGYDVYRDGILIGSTAATAYLDATAKPSTTYAYRIRARDASGNRSPLGDPAQVTTPAPTVTRVYPAVADARVDEARPTTTYGTAKELRAEGGSDPDVVTYLRFQVPAFSGGVYRAIVRVFVPNRSGYGTVDGPALYVARGAWSEGFVTWQNRPAPGALLDDVGAVTAGSWMEYDVTAVIPTGITYDFGLVSSSTDVVVMSSREGVAAPQLVLVAYASGAPAAAEESVPDAPGEASTATPTAASSPTATPTATPPAATLPLTDGFESGDLAAWQAVDGLVVDPAAARTGAWRAQARSDGAPASARRVLREPVDDLYASVAIQVQSRDGSADLVTFVDERGRPLATLLVDRRGNAAIRNERTRRVTALRPLDPLAWHTVQLHLTAAGRSSALEVWLDGDLVFRDGLALRDGRIAAVQLGDAVGGRFAVAFDDLTLDRACIGTCSSTLVTPAPSPAPTEPSATAEPTAPPSETPLPEVTATPPPTEEPAPEPTATPEPTVAPTESPPPAEDPTPEGA